MAKPNSLCIWINDFGLKSVHFFTKVLIDLKILKMVEQIPIFHHFIISLFPPGRRLYPPACKPYGLEVGPEASCKRSELIFDDAYHILFGYLCILFSQRQTFFLPEPPMRTRPTLISYPLSLETNNFSPNESLGGRWFRAILG
jgi:hypothetical protein